MICWSLVIKPFVIDTNAIICAYILENSKNRRAYNKAFNSGIILYSAKTFDEFAEVIVRSKFEKYLPFVQRLSAIKEFQARAFWIDVVIDINICRDPKDNKFPELAVASNASCIITGDDDLFVLSPFRGIPILNTADFLTMF